MSDDRCYFEMDETEAELKHMQDDLEFMHYAISTGKPFPATYRRNYEKIQKINDLCYEIGKNLIDAMENIDKLEKIYSGRGEV